MRLANSQDFEISSKVLDLYTSIYALKDTPGILNLSDQMKVSIVSGITTIKELICVKAFKFFRTTEFDVTDEIIPVMREIVAVALDKGLI